MTNPADGTTQIPDRFLQRMVDMLGNEFNDFVTSLRQAAKIGLRVNTLKVSTHEFGNRSPFFLSPVSWCRSGFIVSTGEDKPTQLMPGKHPYHAAGLYYVQEPSAMAAAEILSPQPGEEVLDLSAAPGGKATHLACLMKNTGFLAVNEIHPKRVWDLVENLERCGVTHATVINETPGRLADHFGDIFDRVLLDAPCSGEGMFRKSEIARKEWKPELAQSCAVRQSAILEQAARLVKPGGRLAYTTCTFSIEENEGVIARFLDQHPEFCLMPIQPFLGFSASRPEWIDLPAGHQINRAVRIWPHHSDGEGHFIALLQKMVDAESQSAPHSHKQKRLSNRDRNLKTAAYQPVVEDFCRENLTISLDPARLVLDGSFVYQLQDGSPDLSSIKVIRPGWWIGSINKNRFTPSHSLAMGITADHAKQNLSLGVNDNRLKAYLSGESFADLGEDSWVLITVDGYPLGWGKRVQDVIKNYYPHGLRRYI